MLGVRKSGSTRLPQKLPNPSALFERAPAERFVNTVNQNSGNGQGFWRARGEMNTSGLLVLDASLRPIYASEEAVAILVYPRAPSNRRTFDNYLKNRIRSLIASNGDLDYVLTSNFPKEVSSGKRCYKARAFSMKSSLGIERGFAVAVLLERNHRSMLNLEIAARQFRLTQRETETVDLLVQDLSTKEIAARMAISPNTAKAFIRSAMIKLNVENRTGITGKILQASSFVNGENFI